MAVSTTNLSTNANALQTVVNVEAGDAVQANIVLADLVDNQFELQLRVGKAVIIEDRSNPAIRVKSEDTTATWANKNETSQTITVTRQAYAAMLFEDIAQIQATGDLRGSYSADMGYSLAAYLEGDATSGLQSLPDNFSQLAGTLGAPIAEDQWIKAGRLLDSADAPRSGRFIWASPAAHWDLQALERLSSADFVGEEKAKEAMLKGMVGEAFGAVVYVSSLAENNPSTADQAYSWFCHQRGVALIRQRRPTAHIQYVILETAWGVLTDMIYQFAERLIAPKDLGGGTSVDTHSVGVRGI